MCPLSDNTLNIIHYGVFTKFCFKLYPVLTNLLKFKFALWVTYVPFPELSLCILATKPLYLHLSEPQYSLVYCVRDMQMRE